MSFTYTTLKAAIRSYHEISSDDFSASGATLNDTDIAIIVKQAEDRILKEVQLPNFKKTDADVTVDGTATLAIPSDFLSSYHLAVDNSGYEFLIFKDMSFIREVYPDSTVKGTPKYYAIEDDDNFLLGPTPDAVYTTELYYFYRPTSIVDGATSWLGTHAEATLLSGCILEAYIFLKGDSDLMEVYATRYKESLIQLKLLGEGRMTTDVYRSG